MVKNPYRSFQIAKVAYFWNYVFVFYISPIIESIFFTCLCCPWIQFLVIWRKQKHGFRLSHLFFYMVFFVTYQTIYTLYLKKWDQVFPLSILPLDILFYIFQIWHLIRKVCLLQILIYISTIVSISYFIYIFLMILIFYLHFFSDSVNYQRADRHGKEGENCSWEKALWNGGGIKGNYWF